MFKHLTEPFENHSMSDVELEQTNAEIKHQIALFALMIFLTAIAFLAIGADVVPSTFAIPFILILALLQLGLQLLYFMHMKDKNHGWAGAFMITGMFLATPTVAALILLIGIVKY